MPLRVLAILSLLLLSGCGGPDYSTMNIRLYASLTDPQGFAGLTLWVGGRPLVAADERRDGRGPSDMLVRVPNGGDLVIRMELRQGGRVVSGGEFTIGMLENFEWSLGVQRRVDDPALLCLGLGCVGSAGFPIAEDAQAEAGETVWFSWGGQPRGSNIVT